MKIILIFLTIFFVYLTICEAGKKKRLPKKKEKGSSSQNPPVIDPVVKAIRDFKMKNLDDWERFDYLKSYLEEPKETGEYDKMVNEAKEKLLKDKENTLNEFLENVKRALQGRKLRYVRLIGPGSMHGHSNHYLYREDKGRNKAREVFLSFSEKYKKLFIKSSQIRAVYQFAVQILTIEHFDNIQNPKKEEEIKLKHKGKAIASSSGTNISDNSIIGTVEELYINESEKEYIEGKYKISAIIPEVRKNKISTNLYKIPSIVDKMEEDEATLIIMLECPFDMTKEIINSYKKENKLKNLIIVETGIGNELKRNPIEIINFSNDNKLEILQAFPHSIVVENLLAGAFIYYNKLGDEELNKLIVSSQEVKKEDVKVDAKEKVEDKKKEEKKDEVKDEKNKGVKEKNEDEKKQNDEKKKDVKSEKKGVKFVKDKDVRIEVKEKNDDEKKKEDEKKDAKKENKGVKFEKDEDKKKEDKKTEVKKERKGVSDKKSEDDKVEMKQKLEDEMKEGKEEIKDEKKKGVSDEQKEKVKMEEDVIEDEKEEGVVVEVNNEKNKGAKDEQKEDVKVEEKEIKDEMKEGKKEEVKDEKIEVNEKKKEKVEE